MPEIDHLIGRVLPPGVGLGLPQVEPPWPGEVLPRALPARMTEFRQGRAAARAAMRAAGLQPGAILANADRSPRWPNGIRGSITHCQGACIAIAAAADQWGGLGIDVEPAKPIDQDLWPLLLSREELGALPETAPGMRVLDLFVAKEAAYKAQFARSGQLLDFHDLNAHYSADGFVILTFARDTHPFSAGQRLTVRLFHTAAYVAALCLIRADERATATV